MPLPLPAYTIPGFQFPLKNMRNAKRHYLPYLRIDGVFK